jgi:hypothetical protein
MGARHIMWEMFVKFWLYCRSVSHSVVSTGTIDYVISWMILGSNVCKSKKFFSSPKCPDLLWGPPSFLFKVYWLFFPWQYSNQSMKLTTHLYLMPMLRKSVAVPPQPLDTSVVWTGWLLFHIITASSDSISGLYHRYWKLFDYSSVVVKSLRVLS